MTRLLQLFLGSLALFTAFATADATEWPLAISQDGRFLTERNGTPYFPIIDTVWMLSYLSQADVDVYLASRPAKGFNAVLVSLIGVENLPHGRNSPNYKGHKPFVGRVGRPDTTKPNPAFFENFKVTLRKLRAKNMTVFLVLGWAAAWQDAFTAESYKRYVEFVLNMHPVDEFPHIVWCLGGDKGMHMQKNLNKPMQIVAGRHLRRLMNSLGDRRLISEHPGRGSSVINYSPQELSGWLDIYMVQSGHRGPTQDVPDWVRRAYQANPVKPVFNGEPLYEAHNPGVENADVRWAHWVSVFSGACGVGYGCHGFWGIGADVAARRRRPGHSNNWWKKHLDDQPVGNQVKHFATLNLAYPFHLAAPDFPGDGALIKNRGQDGAYRAALVARDRTWALVYLPHGDATDRLSIQMDHFRTELPIRWFDPTSGAFTQPLGPFPNVAARSFDPPKRNRAGQRDWVLVLGRSPVGKSGPGKRLTSSGTAED